jgi:hypothetical protein
LKNFINKAKGFSRLNLENPFAFNETSHFSPAFPQTVEFVSLWDSAGRCAVPASVRIRVVN